MRSRLQRLLLVALLTAPAIAKADNGPALSAPDAGVSAAPATVATSADKAAAAKAVEAYLNEAKDKKWDDVRALTHPRTLEVIADEKQRGIEDNEMAPWSKMDQEYVVSFELGMPEANAKGSVVVPTTQSRFSVEDHGTEDGVQIEYLAIPLNGKWYVTDMRRGVNEFPASTVPEHYKGYFQDDYTPPAPIAAPAKKKKPQPDDDDE